MDCLTRTAACAVVLFSFTLTACGGGSSTTSGPTSGGSGGGTAIQGVSTPSSVSVVTAKNAQ